MELTRGLTARHTDVENSERLVSLFGDNLRFVGRWDKGLAWAGNRWILDDTGKWQLAGVETARRLYAEAFPEYEEAKADLARVIREVAADLEDEKERKSDPRVTKAAARAKLAGGKLGWAISSQSNARINAMVNIARAVPKLSILHAKLDADPWVLNVMNGTIDLRTGELREHRREDLITKLAAVDFDPDAQCPTWLAFLERAMAGDASMVDYLQRFVGYCLTGATTEHVLAFLYGGGANGKSTFLSTIHAMMGDYAFPAARGLLFGGKKGDRHPTELASLFGRRFVTGSEVEEGLVFDEALIKDLTGGDPINARRMNEDEWAFDPTHKLALAGNHKPSIRGDDEGIWRRMRLIPWLVQIPAVERDQQLPDKLRAELPGILAWAVRGCLEWQKSGLDTPSAVQRATSAYRTENDLLGEYLRLHAVFETEARVSRKDLRASYETFCKDTGAEPFGAKRFAGRLRERGVSDSSVRVGTKVVDAWKGIRLASDLEREMAFRGMSVVTCSDENGEKTKTQSDAQTQETGPYVPTTDEPGAFDDILNR